MKWTSLWAAHWSSLLVISALFVGCGGSSSQSACVTNCTSALKAEMLYATGRNQVSGFSINTSTGALSAPETIPGPNDSVGIAGSPAANLLYVSDFAGNALDGFSINSSSGALGTITGFPLSLGNSPGAAGIAIDPAGKFLFVTDLNAGVIEGFNIGPHGTLSSVGGSPFPASNSPSHAAVDPSGKFLFVSNTNDALGGISAYRIGSTGTLSVVQGSPFPTQAFGGPATLAVHSSGKFLYVAMSGTANPNHLIFAFTIDFTTGILGPVANSPFNAGTDPLFMTMDSSGQFLYTSNIQDNTVSAFAIKPSNGDLTPVAGSPYPLPSVGGLTVDASGKFLYVASPSSNAIAGFNINPLNGELTAIAGSPFKAGSMPQMLTSVAVR